MLFPVLHPEGCWRSGHMKHPAQDPQLSQGSSSVVCPRAVVCSHSSLQPAVLLPGLEGHCPCDHVSGTTIP